jgi:hypothetical protein
VRWSEPLSNYRKKLWSFKAIGWEWSLNRMTSILLTCRICQCLCLAVNKQRKDTSKTSLIWRKWIWEYSCSLKFTSYVDAHFKQNKDQVIETHWKNISNLTHFKDLLISEDYDAIWRNEKCE